MSQPLATITQPTNIADAHTAPSGAAPDRVRTLAACAVAAGPLFVVVALVQALTRPGFDLTRHAVSLLSIGSAGWVQIANFMITGLLMLAGAVGVRRLLRGSPGGRWAPLLTGIFGAGLTAAGVFHPDPSDGFPPGTAANASAVSSWHGVLHMLCGSAAFLALVAACFVLAHHFAARGRRRSAICSRVVGVLCAAGIAAGGGPFGSLTLFLGVSLGWLWIGLTTARLLAAEFNAGDPRILDQPARTASTAV